MMYSITASTAHRALKGLIWRVTARKVRLSPLVIAPSPRGASLHCQSRPLFRFPDSPGDTGGSFLYRENTLHKRLRVAIEFPALQAHHATTITIYGTKNIYAKGNKTYPWGIRIFGSIFFLCTGR